MSSFSEDRESTFSSGDYGWGSNFRYKDDDDDELGQQQQPQDMDDADNHDGLHGASRSEMKSGLSKFMHKVTRFIQRRSQIEKIIAFAVVLILVVIVVHHRLGPSHALTEEERERRYLAQREIQAGRVSEREGYVTLAINNDEANAVFSLSAALISVRSTRMLHVMVTSDVSLSVRSQLRSLPNVGSVNVVGSALLGVDQLSGIGTDEWREHFLKLTIWRDMQFTRVVFLDPQVIVLRNLDALFQHQPTDTRVYTAYVTAPAQMCSLSGGDATAIDTSVMVLKPSIETYKKLINKLIEITVQKHAPSFNVADIILSVFEGPNMLMHLPRPDYGFSAHEICQCPNNEIQYSARILRDTVISEKLPGPVTNNDKSNEANEADYADCMIYYQKLWARQHKQARKFLL